ncbi:MAG: 4-hydroxy-tetrahydrodipicolinate reductase [Oscillospiraceae bacterium]|nr:4-hydroxy-tetrahydrodipicolinate reductase [Oscillospiraceae bacterium]
MIKIALTGACGRMGKVIAGLIAERKDCKVNAGVDPAGKKYGDFEIYDRLSALPESPDVIIDFSHTSALDEILTFCKSRSIPAVIATTGYTQDEIVKIKIAAEHVPVFFTFNMSLGINLLADLARRTARVLGSSFDMEIIEKHHNLKADSPSGTAIMLADALNEESGGALKYVYGRSGTHRPRIKDELGIHSIRGGTIVGEHEIIFAGHDEIISMSHSALSREVFASGAINAALFLAGREKGLYDMTDLLNSI